MGRSIVKLERDGREWYLEWSSIVDAPVSYGLPLEEFQAYYFEWYGDGLDARMARVDRKGTSSLVDCSAEEQVESNRAGLDETCLSYDQIIDVYCLGQENVLGEGG